MEQRIKNIEQRAKSKQDIWIFRFLDVVVVIVIVNPVSLIPINLHLQ